VYIIYTCIVLHHCVLNLIGISELCASLSAQPVGGSIESLVLEQLLALVDCLVSREVGLVLCQKCVHPLVKQRLRKKASGQIAIT